MLSLSKHVAVRPSSHVHAEPVEASAPDVDRPSLQQNLVETHGVAEVFMLNYETSGVLGVRPHREPD